MTDITTQKHMNFKEIAAYSLPGNRWSFEFISSRI